MISSSTTKFNVCKWRIGLFGHVARLPHNVLANQILRICIKVRDSEWTSQEWRCAVLPTSWIHQFCRDMAGAGVTVTEALHCSWRRTDHSGRRSQLWEASATCSASWWWWLMTKWCRKAHANQLPPPRLKALLDYSLTCVSTECRSIRCYAVTLH